ncbi:SDR family oxidoreductase [Sandaracinus amylolyticus]|uniref:3-oxoacyl-[acyl-carrier protein] reductase n=1 Tax=Sandaracinus amylolyticus TaxID=927083 RepID=A0A0F6W1U6_9BACT|nr:SDR family oxidoreductase [Sandaracinus amylolyticus]AKF05115.1 3-oxoacyl-[acyl-carrier protein] reductase [Sandaracinus amylolyticus]
MSNEKVVWITGASSGIGEALALELARGGAKLVLSARRADRLEALRLRCPDPARVAVLPLDVADTTRAKEHAETAQVPFGRVDVMVHNAGITQRSLVVDTALDVDRRIMEVNYFGVVALTKALLPSMIARKSGHFVVVSSVVGYVGTQQRSAYAASKHALHGFFEALRAEGHADGVKVTMVCPGYVSTDLTLSALRGDGSVHGERAASNAAGMSPAQCAHRIAHAIETQPREVYVGGREVAAIYLRRFAPGLLARILPRVNAT